MYESEKQELKRLRDKYCDGRPWNDDDKLSACGLISAGILASEQRDEYQVELKATEDRLLRFLMEANAALDGALEQSDKSLHMLQQMGEQDDEAQAIAEALE